MDTDMKTLVSSVMLALIAIAYVLANPGCSLDVANPIVMGCIVGVAAMGGVAIGQKN